MVYSFTIKAENVTLLALREHKTIRPSILLILLQHFKSSRQALQLIHRLASCQQISTCICACPQNKDFDLIAMRVCVGTRIRVSIIQACVGIQIARRCFPIHRLKDSFGLENNTFKLCTTAEFHDDASIGDDLLYSTLDSEPSFSHRSSANGFITRRICKRK